MHHYEGNQLHRCKITRHQHHQAVLWLRWHMAQASSPTQSSMAGDAGAAEHADPAKGKKNKDPSAEEHRDAKKPKRCQQERGRKRPREAGAGERPEEDRGWSGLFDTPTAAGTAALTWLRAHLDAGGREGNRRANARVVGALKPTS